MSSGGATKGHEVGVSSLCPTGYCISVIANQDLNISQTDINICLPNRTGILCSECAPNHSLVFGSNKCMKCSDWSLLTLLTYVIAGLLLVFLLFALRLTLTTGTINGIIFYANAANAGILEGMVYFGHQPVSLWTRTTLVFLAWINIDQGFPVCFYQSMTQLIKTALYLFFPVYLLAIVGILIIASHYSVTISNRIAKSSIQVLVTIVHLSFSKLLLLSIDVYTYTIIYTANGSTYVWYWDGNVTYGDQNHWILMLITTVTVGVVVIPYFTLLLGARPLMKIAIINKYFRPVVESIHAPYKDKYQYWFVARMILLVCIYIIYIILRGRDVSLMSVLIGGLVTLFLLAQTYIKPYKNRLINILDCWLMLNFCFQCCAIWYSINHNEDHTLVINIFPTLFVLTFIMVIVYHILNVCGISNKLVHTYHKIETLFTKRISQHYKHITRCETDLSTKDSDSFSGSFSDLREPALSL